MPKSRRLNSDQLGAKGEQRFAELCLDAELEPNKSERDRHGWDFLVEFPFATPVPDEDIAARAQPPECRIQVKTRWDSQSQIKLRLSSAERLAKKETPTFICVLTVNNALEYTHLHVLHVDGELLDIILKKLREMQDVSKSISINKEFLYVSVAKHGVEIEVSGDALRSYIQTCVGSDYRTYVQRKITTLKETGFSSTPLRGSFTVESSDPNEFADFLLGLTPLPAVSFEMSETRWDIELPVTLPILSQGSEIRLRPRPFNVDVTFRQSAKRPIRFGMGLTVPPIGTGDGIPSKQLLSHPNIQFEFGGATAYLQISGPKSIPTMFQALKKLNALDHMLLDGEVDIQVEHRGRKMLGMRFTRKNIVRTIEQVEGLDETLVALQDILDEVGLDNILMPPNLDETFLGLLNMLHSMLCTSDAVKASATVHVAQPATIESQTMEVVFVDRLDFASEALAFYAVCQGSLEPMDDSHSFKLRLEAFSLRQITPIEKTREALEDFRQYAQDITGITSCMSMQSPI